MSSTKEIAEYYNKWTGLYLETYGDTIQGCRTPNLPDLHQYILQQSGMTHGHRILDGGCGVCGPSVYFAQKLDVKIDGMTISPVQKQMADERIKAEGLQDKINVICDDFYNADKHFAPETFDIVIFLEALGHSDRAYEVAKKMWHLIKPGGVIFIKDYFINESDLMAPEKRDLVINNINTVYHYHTMELNPLVSALRQAGFVLEWILNPDHEKSWQHVFDFEQRAGFDSWGGMEKFAQWESFELRFRKI